MEIGREKAKQMFRDDKNSQGCYRSVMTKINKIYDSFEAEIKVNNDTVLLDDVQAVEKAKKFIDDNPNLCNGIKSKHHTANLMAKFCSEINKVTTVNNAVLPDDKKCSLVTGKVNCCYSCREIPC